MDVLVIGAMGLDVKGTTIGPLEPGGSRPGVIRCSPGGVARNIAESLARLELEVSLISAVGDDWTGQHLLQQARAVGIDTQHVVVRPNGRTGIYLALYDQEQNPVYAMDDMAGMDTVTPRYIYDRRRLIRDARMVVIDGNVPPNALETILRVAESYQRPVCADPTSTVLASRFRPHLSRFHLLTPNLEEAEALLGEPELGLEENHQPLRLARRLVKRGVDLAVITLAERGLCYATADESGHLPTFAVSIVDRTGVGDALTAGIVFGLLEELPADEAVRLGLSAAALTLQCRETVCPDLSLETLYARLVI
jgi:pseudouridine kinase